MNRSLEDYSPWCHEESDMTVCAHACTRAHTHTHTHTHTHRVASYLMSNTVAAGLALTLCFTLVTGFLCCLYDKTLSCTPG